MTSTKVMRSVGVPTSLLVLLKRRAKADDREVAEVLADIIGPPPPAATVAELASARRRLRGRRHALPVNDGRIKVIQARAAHWGCSRDEVIAVYLWRHLK